MEPDAPYDAYDAVVLEVNPLKRRVEALEEKLDAIALSILPNGYRLEKKATKVMCENSKSKTRKMKHKCSACHAEIGGSDLYCRNCGATLYGFTIGAVNDED